MDASVTHAAKTLDEHFPPRGLCGFCGGPDARHRLFDMLRERNAAGDSLELLAADYDLSVEAVLLAIDKVMPGHGQERDI